MTIAEVKQLVDKIKIHRPTFGGQFDKSGMDKLKLEWFKVLEEYDYPDVNKKLDDFLRDGDNFGRYPDVYYLIRYLKKHNEKSSLGDPNVRCQLCRKVIKYSEYQTHYERCSSVNYLYNMSLEYFNQELNKDKLMSADKKTFDEYYWSFKKKLLPKIDDPRQKHLLENSILTYEGKKAKYELGSC